MRIIVEKLLTIPVLGGGSVKGIGKQWIECVKLERNWYYVVKKLEIYGNMGILLLLNRRENNKVLKKLWEKILFPEFCGKLSFINYINVIIILSLKFLFMDSFVMWHFVKFCKILFIYFHTILYLNFLCKKT